MKPYFIMLHLDTQAGLTVTPIVDEDDEVALYESEFDAHEAMSDHPAAKAFDYEIFELGSGVNS